MAYLYVFIKLHVILFNEVLNNKFPKTNPAVPSSLLAPENWCHCHWISTPLIKHAHPIVRPETRQARFLDHACACASHMPHRGEIATTGRCHNIFHQQFVLQLSSSISSSCLVDLSLFFSSSIIVY